MNKELVIVDHPLTQLLSLVGINSYVGMTGGGVIHLLKHLKPITNINQPKGFFTMSEYASGFVPLGYYLASKKICAAVATTGAATKLLTCGLSDAKLHNIPAVYIVPTSEKDSWGLNPLQDSSPYGNNILGQLLAELPESTFLLDRDFSPIEDLPKIYRALSGRQPIVFVLTKYTEQINFDFSMFPQINTPLIDPEIIQIHQFQSMLRGATFGKRLVILVGEEMNQYEDAKELTTLLSHTLQAETIWSINGANAVSRNNKYGYGYVLFGGNDKAVDIFKSLGSNDVLLLLGACSDEYTTNMDKIAASHTFYLGSNTNKYGLFENSNRHLTEGKYDEIRGHIPRLLNHMIQEAKKIAYRNIPAKQAPKMLNNEPYQTARAGYVDMAVLYQKLDESWIPNSIAFDDVCLAYKDRQYVVQRPNDNIEFYSLYRGSAMGGAFGAAVGAKMGDPEKQVFCFTGDGCFRLFCGSMGEVADFGIVLFVLNNQVLGIVDQGLLKVLPNTEVSNYHASLRDLDYKKISEGFGWNYLSLDPDLNNFAELEQVIRTRSTRSLLVEIPVDPKQMLGKNQRLANL